MISTDSKQTTVLIHGIRIGYFNQRQAHGKNTLPDRISPAMWFTLCSHMLHKQTFGDDFWSQSMQIEHIRYNLKHQNRNSGCIALYLRNSLHNFEVCVTLHPMSESPFSLLWRACFFCCLVNRVVMQNQTLFHRYPMIACYTPMVQESSAPCFCLKAARTKIPTG